MNRGAILLLVLAAVVSGCVSSDNDGSEANESALDELLAQQEFNFSDELEQIEEDSRTQPGPEP